MYTEVLMSQGDKAAKDLEETVGCYSNYFKVGHNAFEFRLDFGQFYPESQRASFHTRIITAPIYAKALLEILQAAVAGYEQTFGAIL